MSEFTGTIAVPCLDLFTVMVRVQHIDNRAGIMCRYLRTYTGNKPAKLFTSCLRCLISMESLRANTSDGEQRLYEAIQKHRVIILAMEEHAPHGCRRCQPHLHKHEE